jgi:proprotein convertase subtilisin/kexin type 5
VTATNCLNCSGNFTIIAPGTCGCAVGTYVSGTNNCSACNFRCATCSGTSTDCTTCPDTRNNSATGCPCNEGYFEVNNVAACTACDPACTACTSLTNCQNCVSGRVKQGNNCICEDHYYSPTGSICLPCHYSCDSCSA